VDEALVATSMRTVRVEVAVFHVTDFGRFVGVARLG